MICALVQRRLDATVIGAPIIGAEVSERVHVYTIRVVTTCDRLDKELASFAL